MDQLLENTNYENSHTGEIEHLSKFYENESTNPMLSLVNPPTIKRRSNRNFVQCLPEKKTFLPKSFSEADITLI